MNSSVRDISPVDSPDSHRLTYFIFPIHAVISRILPIFDNMQTRNYIICFFFFLCLTCKPPTKKSEAEFIFPTPSSVEKILIKGFLNISTFYSTTDYYIYKGITRGFHYDLAKDFADYLGVKLRIADVNNDIDTAIAGLLKGKYDLIAVSMTETPERKEKIKFAHPLFTTGEVIVQRNTGTIKQLKELDGKNIFIKKDAPYKQLLQQLQDSLHIHIKVTEVAHYGSEDLLHLVETGEIDYTITDENIAKALSLSMKNLDYSLRLRTGISVSWAMDPASVQLNEEVNNWLKEIQKNGKLNMLYKRYFNNSQSIPQHKSKYVIVRKGDLSPFDQLLKKESKKLNWDWRLLAALVYTESQFNPEAESHVGAYGLMQVIPETANMFNVYDYFSPDSNVYTGVQYLKYLNDVFVKYPISDSEKLKFILASYNVGAGHVLDAMRLAQKYGKNPHIWDNNVDYYLQHKSYPQFYRDSVCRNGYCNGQQAYEYVHRVLDTWNNYRFINFKR